VPDAAGHVIPADWPEAPPDATYHSPSLFGWQGYGFTVAAVPPQPFPFIDDPTDTPPALFGPGGTVWVFRVSDVVERLTHLDSTLTKLAIERALRKLRIHIWGSGLYMWRTPERAGEPPPMAIRIIRATVHGKIGTDEEVAHVLNLRTSPTPDVDQDAAALKTLGGQLRDLWSDFLSTGVTPYGQGTQVRGYMPAQIQYDEIRLAYLEIVPGVRPRYLVPTQYVPYAGLRTGGGGLAQPNGTNTPLPYEVAMALSFNTEFRGRSHRGRMYLGPLTAAVMGTDGNFGDQAAAIGQAFGDKVVRGLVVNTGADLHVLSEKYGYSYPVQGVRVGRVPDSQRRRRRSRQEVYVQSYGQPVGVPYAAPV